MHNDYTDAGYRVFGLHGAGPNGGCACGNPECQAAFKHPINTNWQSVPQWSDEQLEVMEQTGQFATGFGVLVDGLLVVDIDPRNGGKPFPLLDETCKFVVSTGGGGWHYYYKAPPGVALLTKVDAYKGIDFKSSGYVVGAGSLHASGTSYEIERGHPDDIGDAPQELIDMIKRPDKFRAVDHDTFVDVSEQELADVLSHIDPDTDYDTWIKCGMAIHDATGGACFSIWDQWSRAGKKYNGQRDTEYHWHSFGKALNPVRIGTLMHHAHAAGYSPPVTFESSLEMPATTPKADNIDLLRPPGFVGELCAWMNDQCRYPREHLVATTAIVTLGNILGPGYICGEYDIAPNLIAFCVAGSGSGKEAVQDAMKEVHNVAGVSHASYGRIKSEQEIIRNLCSDQRALYVNDEVGDFLAKVTNAQKRGGSATYLEGVIATLMETFTKSRGTLLLGGDVKRDMEKTIGAEIAALNKQIDNKGDKSGAIQEKIEKLTTGLNGLASGLPQPFLSMNGFSTPDRFRHIVNHEQVTAGFIGRSLIAVEKETVPRMKRGFKKRPMSKEMAWTLKTMAAEKKEPVIVATEPAAAELLVDIIDRFHDMAVEAKDWGLEALPRRAFEMVAKISLILGAPGGLRTVEHVQWAFAYATKDIETKMDLARTSIAEEDKRFDDALISKIKTLLDNDQGESIGVIVNRCRPHKAEHVEAAVKEMIDRGLVKEIQGKRKPRYVLA